ncbi:hypothetical protein [Sulfurospirillum arcachonense]|uniref:hypothetical protein n=1 Tax=Sulfurospirillum arcachonense TaxID=57666 RepID=UPI0004689438|nr:hypothetical protein [Sulfurospirillum arcachonense]
MAFINEYASQEDINKFKLDELLNKYLNAAASYKYHWTIDKDTNSWLMPLKQLNSSETIWIVHYKNTNIEIKLWMVENRWDLISIASNSFNNVEIIEILQKALMGFNGKKIIWAIPKKIEKIETIQPKRPKRIIHNKDIYISFLLVSIIASIVFFILQKSTNDRKSIEVKKINKNTNRVKKKGYEQEINNIIVIDKNKDGSILTTMLKKSSIYFDLTGDGIKTKVGWLKHSDAILVYDKNNNGKIDNINELIRNKNIIDDNLYLKLKIWQDKNEDAISQADELVKFDMKYLSYLKVIKLKYDPRISYKDVSTIKDYKENPISKTLPFLRGYGVVIDSNIAYNLDNNLQKLAIEYASDIQKTANEFEIFMDVWSGYNKMQKDLQKKYNLEKVPKLSDVERKIWTMERFTWKVNSDKIEAKLETIAKGMQHGGSDIALPKKYNYKYVNTMYNKYTNRCKAFFSLDAFYSDLLKGNVEHKRGIDRYVIKNKSLFYKKVAKYLNDEKNTIFNKLYLAQQMKVLKGTFLDFDRNKIISKINDNEIRGLISDIFTK